MSTLIILLIFLVLGIMMVVGGALFMRHCVQDALEESEKRWKRFAKKHPEVKDRKLVLPVSGRIIDFDALMQEDAEQE